ncbi:hypothetical protein [Couchioplanes azureus]|uniref:hypothetical protein n=1 Tax=Couchioplanes caeruleus TaxID=56438 RepID=UPI00188B054F|nr:hypothetical protein [Couchioplanes caeruleus]
MTELPIAVRVKTPQGVVVALPRGRSRQQALDMASVILSSDEFEQLRHALGTSATRARYAARFAAPVLRPVPQRAVRVVDCEPRTSATDGPSPSR